MRWLDRVRKVATPPTFDPTKPTKGASVGFVGTSPATFPEMEGVNDPEFSGDPGAHDAAEMAGARHPFARASRIGDRHQALVMLFHSRGLRNDEAEALARDVVRRARDFDDRRLCLECRNLRGSKCAVPNVAGAGVFVAPLLRMPQRCAGFEVAS